MHLLSEYQENFLHKHCLKASRLLIWTEESNTVLARLKYPDDGMQSQAVISLVVIPFS
jgi:hypothetical protein